MHVRRMLARHKRWLAAVTAVTAISLLSILLAGAPLQAGDAGHAVRTIHPQHQVLNDDLVVAAGETYDGDVVVYNGDVTVEEGGRIAGSLIVYRGDVEIKQGGSVGGDLTAVSGDVQIDGRVGGSVALISGDAELGAASYVGGDVSVVSGSVEQARSAYVGGSTLRGPDLNIQIPAVIAPNAVPGVDVRPPMPPFGATRPLSFGEQVLGFFGRTVAAGMVLLLLIGGAAAVAALRPQLAADVRTTLRRQTALSFAVGLLVNMLGIAIIGFMAITICLAPPAILLGLLLLAANVVGLSGAGELAADRLPVKFQAAGVARTAVGVAVPAAVVSLLWLLGGCFAFFGYVLAMLLASFGLGAFLVKLLKLGEPAPAVKRTTLAPEGPPTPEAPPSPVGVATTDAAETQQAAAPVTPRQDDFRLISGIGAVFQQRLYDAGIDTYADLAACTPEEVAEILRWSVERVAHDRILEQAAALAAAR